MTFDIIDVSDWPVMAPEAGGDDNKDWIAPPDEAKESLRADWWLFKSAKYGELKLAGGTGTRTYRRRDDQAEVIASSLAMLIDLPAAEVKTARRGDEYGIISKNVTPPDWDLQPGNTYLSEFPGYESCDVPPDQRPKNRVGHNLHNIERLLESASGPPGTWVERWAAFDVFVGFLVFDAWIANTDRHALNWGLLTQRERQCLAKSYDHGSAFGSGIDEERIPSLLEGDGLEEWCQRGTARRFEGGRKLPLVDLAGQGLQLATKATEHWTERICALDRQAWQDILGQVPSMSEAAYNLADGILTTNRKRLVDGG